VWDPSEARVPVDSDGNFTFAPQNPEDWVVDSSGAFAFEDLNGTGVWDPATEQRAPVGPNGGLPTAVLDALSPQTTTLADPLAPLGSLVQYAAFLNGLPIAQIDTARYGDIMAIGGEIQGTGTTDATPNNGAVDLGGQVTGITGLVGAGQTVFLDLNHDGKLDSGDPYVTADQHGFYTFAPNFHPVNTLGLLAPYDTDGNGKIDPSEGTIVVTGGTDKNNGLSVTPVIRLNAQPGNAVQWTASPLATLEGQMLALGVSESQAAGEISSALGLSNSNIDFTTFDPTASGVSAADSVAVQTAASKVDSLVLNGAAIIVASSGGTVDSGMAQLAVYNALATAITKAAGTSGPVNLNDTSTIASILNAAAASSGAQVSQDAISAAASITASLNAQADVYAAGDASILTRQLARIDAIVQSKLADSLGQVVAGTLTPSAAEALYSGDALVNLLNGVTLVPQSPPVVSQISDQSDTAGSSVAPIAFDVDSATSTASQLKLTVHSSNQALLPDSGITLSGADQHRFLSMAPVNGATGDTTITLTVTDGDQSTVRTFNLDVKPAAALVPEITSSPATTAVAGQVYSYTIVAQPGAPNRSIVITAANELPSWLTLTDNGDGTAVLTGTPGADLLSNGGSLQLPIAIAATDLSGAAVTQNFNLVVSQTQVMPPTLNAVTPPDAVIGSLYTLNLSATLGSQGQTLTISAAAPLPSWLQLTDNGDGTAVVTGTPNAANAGPVTLTFAVTDDLGESTTQAFKLTVAPVPTIAQLVDQSAAENSGSHAVTVQLGGIDPSSSAATLTVVSSNKLLLPAANVILAGTGVTRTLTYTPAANVYGSTTLTLTLTEYGVTTTESFVVNVTPVDHPVAQVAPLPSYTIGVNSAPIAIDLSSRFASTDGNVTYAVTGNSDAALLGVKIVGSVLTITPTAGMAGLDTLTVTATSIGAASGRAYTASGTIQLNILPSLTVVSNGFLRNAGGTFAQFTVSMNATSNQAVKVGFSTASSTAIPGVNFSPLSGTVTIAAGTRSAIIYVLISPVILYPNLGLTLDLESAAMARITRTDMAASVMLPEDRAVLFDQYTGIEMLENSFTLNVVNAQILTQTVGSSEMLLLDTIAPAMDLQISRALVSGEESYAEAIEMISAFAFGWPASSDLSSLATATSLDALGSVREIPTI
jgi:hypothetical protein